MTAADLYPPRTDPYLADMIKWFHQELGSSEVQTRLNGMGDEQFLDFLNRTLQALHGSSVNPSYTDLSSMRASTTSRRGRARTGVRFFSAASNSSALSTSLTPHSCGTARAWSKADRSKHRHH
jgi:hypothetical protein